MSRSLILLIKNKVFILLTITALLLSLLTYYLFQLYLVKNQGIWLAPLFIPIQNYAIIIFLINFFLGVVSFSREKFLSYAFNGVTIAIDILLLLALFFNLINPNG